MCVTPGAVSQQVRQLEDWVGVPLFERAGRGLRLTIEGRQLSERLGPVFEQLERAITDVRSSAAPDHLRLRLAPTLAIRWLVPKLGDFIGRHPGLEVEVSTSAVADEGALDGFDLTVRIHTSRPEREEALLLFRDAFTPVCSPETARQLRAPSDLDRLPRLHSMIRPESWQIWLDGTGLALDPLAGPKFANAALAYQAAAEGLGVAIGQRVYVEADIEAGRLVAPFEGFVGSDMGYWLVNARHKSAWPKVRAFREWCARLVGEQSDQTST
ncbi:LysR family transcriptional regulator [Azoarcus taiwanensis]|uniref:LysR family transcriptional regulator n=1 Tax=Azoarcus taiwanensis TaxID=666964 RepID=A0A972F5J0_9RHOO|nr:LysR family transcriptional regulator [Azoarcus taiwanensis]